MQLGTCIGGAVVLLAAGAGCSSSPVSQHTQFVRVAAAADLRFALDEVVAEFHQAHPALHAEVTSAMAASAIRSWTYCRSRIDSL